MHTHTQTTHADQPALIKFKPGQPESIATLQSALPLVISRLKELGCTTSARTVSTFQSNLEILLKQYDPLSTETKAEVPTHISTSSEYECLALVRTLHEDCKLISFLYYSDDLPNRLYKIRENIFNQFSLPRKIELTIEMTSDSDTKTLLQNLLIEVNEALKSKSIPTCLNTAVQTHISTLTVSPIDDHIRLGAVLSALSHSDSEFRNLPSVRNLLGRYARMEPGTPKVSFAGSSILEYACLKGYIEVIQSLHDVQGQWFHKGFFASSQTHLFTELLNTALLYEPDHDPASLTASTLKSCRYLLTLPNYTRDKGIPQYNQTLSVTTQTGEKIRLCNPTSELTTDGYNLEVIYLLTLHQHLRLKNYTEAEKVFRAYFEYCADHPNARFTLTELAALLSNIDLDQKNAGQLLEVLNDELNKLAHAAGSAPASVAATAVLDTILKGIEASGEYHIDKLCGIVL